MAQPVKRQTWCNLDVFGLLNGYTTWDDQYRSLKYVRKPYENNLEFRDRISKGHYNLPDVSKQGLLNALCNEFNLDTYNVLKKSIFQLSYNPIPSGSNTTQDISGFYKNLSGEWISIGPQIWGDNYESSKELKNGFIVWQEDRFSTISGYKNFSYSKVAEVFRELDDNTELKFIYYVEGVDSNNNKSLIQYTDMNSQTDILDTRFTYKKAFADTDLSKNIVIYTLNDIPSDIKDSIYYDEKTGMAKEFLYNLKTYIDKKFKHTWDKITTNSCIWDIHKSYGSGHIPNFYDSIVPFNFDSSLNQYSGYIGGIESLSYSLYPTEIIESGENNLWYLKIYPGKFYIDGTSFYYFENPQVSYLNFTKVDEGINSGYYKAEIPSGLQRGMYTILAKSGYYENGVISGVFEDHSYYTGIDGDNMWSNILGRVPYFEPKMGQDFNLKIGNYSLNFYNNSVYTNIPLGYEKLMLIWDKILIPSGTLLTYDLNPLNEQNLTFEKFFLYLSLNPNGE